MHRILDSQNREPISHSQLLHKPNEPQDTISIWGSITSIFLEIKKAKHLDLKCKLSTLHS